VTGYRSIIRLYLLMAITLPAILSAQAVANARLISEPLNEELRSEAPLSAHTIVGIMVAGAPGVFGRGRFVYIYTASDPANREVCLEVQRRDGKYRSKNTYLLPPSMKSGYTSLPYPTKYSRELGAAESSEFAMLVTLGGCNAASVGYLVAAVEATTVVPSRLRIAVNAGRARTTIRDQRISNGTGVACQSLLQASSISFDTFCELDVSGVTERRLTAELIERIRDDPPFKTRFIVDLGR
jgi:hypothetical protein